jgi:O-antigen/teichoic acid export membrane protein
VVVIVTKCFIHDDTTANVIIVFCISVFTHAWLLDWFFQGKEEMVVVGIGRGLSAVVYLVLLLVFVRSPNDLLWIAVAAVAGDLAAATYAMAVYRRRETRIRLQFDLKSWKPLVGSSLLLSGGSILAGVSINIPILTLGILASTKEVGIFSAASKFVAFLLTLDRVLGALLLPAASRLSVESPEKLSHRLDLALKWIVVIALPVAVGGTILSDRLIMLGFGAEFVQAGTVFRILVWFFFFTMIHTVFTAGLLALGHERLYTKIMTMSALFYLGTSILGSIMFGVLGAAGAIVFSELATLILMREQFRRFLVVRDRVHVVKSIPAAAAMGIVVYWLPVNSLILSIVVGAIVYFGTLFITKGLTRTDVGLLVERI